MSGSTNDLVDQVLTALPYIPKKIFGPYHLIETGDLHPSHFHILHTVEQVGHIQMSDIARSLSINKSNLTPLIQKLISHDLIRKEKSELDRRVTYVYLTEKGETFLSEQKRRLEVAVEERLSTLSKDDQRQLKEAFQSISKILSTLD
ncbi:MarR family winged helix-turn-helix transcriptional regulator [Alkalibacillus salilacus]|uniref:DNA-binding MarR family transcriptional regulator n=1 Tax=Alkalibacillus salilacus TaxID=284582 RepID=A0ABT9VFZ8_9BACI|nr:MarR family transcriptional regulator [Alkalibacillus salilacus]MDQ0159871.1 DNA-binding MarR family transcriptional regulator [Alkalibacillus salilacus]